MRIIEEDSVGTPNCHPGVALRIPRESDAWRKMQQGIRQHLIVGYAGITRKQKSCGSILENGAASSLIEPVVLEMQHPAIFVTLTQETVPIERRHSRSG